MIQVPPNATIVVIHDAINFRAGIDGTAAIARLVLKKDPMNSTLFVFWNRRGHMLRVLFFDGSGFWPCTKRLSKGCFSGWPTGDGIPRNGLRGGGFSHYGVRPDAASGLFRSNHGGWCEDIIPWHCTTGLAQI